MRTPAAGRVSCAALEARLATPTRITKPSVPPPQNQPLVTGNIGPAVGSRQKPKQMSSPDTALEVLGVVMAVPLPLQVVELSHLLGLRRPQLPRTRQLPR